MDSLQVSYAWTTAHYFDHPLNSLETSFVRGDALPRLFFFCEAKPSIGFMTEPQAPLRDMQEQERIELGTDHAKPHSKMWHYQSISYDFHRQAINENLLIPDPHSKPSNQQGAYHRSSASPILINSPKFLSFLQCFEHSSADMTLCLVLCRQKSMSRKQGDSSSCFMEMDL